MREYKVYYRCANVTIILRSIKLLSCEHKKESNKGSKMTCRRRKGNAGGTWRKSGHLSLIWPQRNQECTHQTTAHSYTQCTLCPFSQRSGCHISTTVSAKLHTYVHCLYVFRIASDFGHCIRSSAFSPILSTYTMHVGRHDSTHTCIIMHPYMRMCVCLMCTSKVGGV
jgi:hypothetical protein